MPTQLRAGLESLSGVSMDDVAVHYNAAEPAQLSAHAFTKGTDIYLGPGQERHLGHEAWHAVQQKQGRVRPTTDLGGVEINDSSALEREADRMGARAAQASFDEQAVAPAGSASASGAPLQMMWDWGSLSEGLGSLGASMWSLGGSLLSTAAANPWTTAFTLLALGGGSAFAARSSRRRNILSGPREGQLGLEDLPEEHWWRMIINPKDHEQASEATDIDDDPGLFYDKGEAGQSPGYKASMTDALRQELLFSGGHLGRKVDFREYRRLHDLVSSKLTFDDGPHELGQVRSRDAMRSLSSNEKTVAFPVVDWLGAGDDRGLHDELYDEQVGGAPLVHKWKSGDKMTRDMAATYYVPDTGNVRVNYTEDKVPEFAQEILDTYYRDVGQAEGNEAKLAAIVRAIRNLHVLHGFRDANGRLHGQLLLNKFLLEQGFNPAILPEQGLGIFGGAYSVDELVEMVSKGMDNFRDFAD